MADPKIGDREYRKPYILSQGGYQDMMRATSDRSVWNQFLESDPVWAEFLFTRAELPDAKSAAELRYLRYLKQSEFKKHYLNGIDYEEMEYLWPGLIPGFIPPDFGWDFPWMPREPGGVWPEVDDPSDSPLMEVCDANSDGCYCPGQCKDVVITANFPITSAQSVFNQGETFTNLVGAGTNSVVLTICAPEGRTGQMRIRVFGLYGCDSTINIYQCDDSECCGECDLEWDWDNSIETIVPPGSGGVQVIGGTPPYSWSIADEDGKWSLSSSTTTGVGNTVIAAAGACGKAVITVTDSCGCVATGSVMNPSSGSWSDICVGELECCFLSGAPDSGWSCVGTRVFEATKVQGGYRQVDRFGSKSFFLNGPPDCETYKRSWSGSECLTRPSSIPSGCSYDADADSGFCSGTHAFTYDVQINPAYYWQQGVNQCCHTEVGPTVNGVRYQEWVC